MHSIVILREKEGNLRWCTVLLGSKCDGVAELVVALTFLGDKRVTWVRRQVHGNRVLYATKMFPRDTTTPAEVVQNGRKRK